MTTAGHWDRQVCFFCGHAAPRYGADCVSEWAGTDGLWRCHNESYCLNRMDQQARKVAQDRGKP